ncbi:CxxC-x17-CxxC domain-containing protein [Patescibacteria group bacterium]
MADTKKQVTDQPVADQPKVEEPKVDPVQDAPAPAGGDAPAGQTDQHGRQLFDVKCSSCGNNAQVPFKPSGDRPVYCRDCYMKQRNDRGQGRQY